MHVEMSDRRVCPICMRKVVHYKTRDILYVKGSYADELIHLFVNHWPSNYGGREKSIPKRAATAQLLVREISSILSLDPSAEIILVGDFNEDSTKEKIIN